MFDRENAIGFLLLGLCGAVAAVMIYAIATDTQLRYTGPAWLAWALAILFIGGTLFGLFAGRIRRRRDGDDGDASRRPFGQSQWPDPRTGPPRRGWRRWWPFGR